MQLTSTCILTPDPPPQKNPPPKNPPQNKANKTNRTNSFATTPLNYFKIL